MAPMDLPPAASNIAKPALRLHDIFILYSRPAGTRFISAYRPEKSRYFGFSRLVKQAARCSSTDFQPPVAAHLLTLQKGLADTSPLLPAHVRLQVPV